MFGNFIRERHLTESILTYLGRSGGRGVPYVLAAFSIGGEAGMNLDDVTNSLGMNTIDVKEIVTELNAGGVFGKLGRRISLYTRRHYARCKSKRVFSRNRFLAK